MSQAKAILQESNFGEMSMEGASSNKVQAGDRAVHDWYRFVLSFPPHLVRRYVGKFGLDANDMVLDLMRSNTRNVYKGDSDDTWVQDHGRINQIAGAIEARRLELGKTSGFERMYARVAKLYFGGMTRHLAELRPFLKPGARLAYVVGDQASFLRVMIRTGQILADLARPLGYEVEGIDLFRTRLATATREQLREEVVLLRWPGGTGHGWSRHSPRQGRRRAPCAIV